MNDLLNDNTKPQNIEQLYYKIFEIVSKLYEIYVPKDIKERKNKEKAKMSDAEIISIQLLIECIGKTQNAGYLFLQANYPKLVNYVERSRFNRLISSLFTVIKLLVDINCNIPILSPFLRCLFAHLKFVPGHKSCV